MENFGGLQIPKPTLPHAHTTLPKPPDFARGKDFATFLKDGIPPQNCPLYAGWDFRRVCTTSLFSTREEVACWIGGEGGGFKHSWGEVGLGLAGPSRPTHSPTHIRNMYCIVLYCIVLYCIALHCIALHCIALHCIALHCVLLWCGVVWCGVVWCGVVWCGVVWCGVVWCGVVWCGVVWCGVVWCGVVWCGVVWCGVVWCGVLCCAEGTVTRRQWPGCLPTGTGKREGGVYSARAGCKCVDIGGKRGVGETWRSPTMRLLSAQKLPLHSLSLHLLVQAQLLQHPRHRAVRAQAGLQQRGTRLGVGVPDSDGLLNDVA